MRALRVLLATLLVTVGLLVPDFAAPDRSLAAEPEALVSITLESFEPSLPQRDSTITITGHVTNTSKKRLSRPRVYFWRNQAPIIDSEGFEQALESASNDPLGARYIPGSSSGPASDALYDSDKPYLDAGAEADFKLTVKVADLALSPTAGIYLMGVHVLLNDSSPAVGRARVFVPILSKAPRNVLQMTSVVALNTRPSLAREGVKNVFVDDHLHEEITPGGRLDRLLRFADQSDVSFAIDPALIEELQAMKSGYQVLEDGSLEDGEGRADAERWLATFTRVLSTRDGYRLLYGSVDVAALTHDGQQGVLRSAAVASKNVALTTSLPLLVWPGRGAADAETVAAAESLEPEAILLSDGSTRATAPLLQGIQRVPIVSYTSEAFAGGPGPDPSDTPVHLQQRLLSESWIQASTEPAGTTLGHVRVISTTAQAAGDDESVNAPWIKQATLSQLLGSVPASWDKDLRYTETTRAKELSPDQLAALRRLSRSWATWQDLLTDRVAAKAAANAALARLASVRNRNADTSFDSIVSVQQGDLDQLLNSIQISATRRVLTPKSRVSFPITIRNMLPASTDPAETGLNSVRVKMVFSSANNQRLSVQTIPLTSPIEPGENYQGNALVDARTNGTVRVTAQLYTASGLPVGRPFPIDVTATQAGTVGWFIAIGAGVVLVGSTALRIRQVARERARNPPSGQPVATDSPAPVDGQPVDAVRSSPAQDTGQDLSRSVDV